MLTNQVILRSDAGMNISDFYRFMLAILRPRLEALEKCIESFKQGSCSLEE